MKTGKTLALTLGVAAGALLALVASKSSKRIRQTERKDASNDMAQDDDSEVHYI